VKNFYQNQENIFMDKETKRWNPQDVLKSVASMQDDNAKLKKTNLNY
jgi:alanyl-tRNA synthetase